MKKVFALLLIASITFACGSNKEATKEGATEETVAANGTETVESPAKTMDVSGKYTILELNGAKLDKNDIGEDMPTMVLEGDSMRYSTNIGCNQINGSYTLKGDSIKFNPGMMTMMACPNSLEASYVVALEQVDNYKIEDYMLKVYQGELLKIVFQPLKR